MADKKDEPELSLEDKPIEPIDVVIEDAVPSELKVVDKPAPAADEGDDVDAAVTALQEQLASEQAARLEATNRANDEAARRLKVEGDLKTFRTDAHKSQFDLVVGQIESLNEKATGLERDLADANAAGDFAKAASVQRQMSRTEAQILRLEDGKADLEARKVDGQDDSALPVRPNDALDPVEKFITGLQVSDRDRAYLRKHKDVVTDQAKFNKLSATANYAANVEGLAPDSDEFYAFIDSKMGYSAAPAKVDTPPPPAPPAQQRKTTTFSAPPSRDSMPINGQQKKTGKIRLSPAQQEAAKDAGQTPGEYAKNLVKLVEEGQLNPNLVQYVN